MAKRENAGRRPVPHWDGKRYRAQVNGRRRHLGMCATGRDPVKRAEAYARLEEIIREEQVRYARGTPRTVASLVEAYFEDPSNSSTAFYRALAVHWVKFAGAKELRKLCSRNDRGRLSDVLNNYHRFLLSLKDEPIKNPDGTVNHRRERRNGPETRRKKLSFAMRTLRFAYAQGWIEELPAMPRLPKASSNPKDIGPADLVKIFEELDHPRRKRAGRYFRFVLAVGCRPGEARELQWSEFRPDLGAHGGFVLQDHKTAHHGRHRTIYLTAEGRSILEEIPDDRTGHVFRSRLGGPYKAGGIRAIIKRIGCTPYQLRHTFAQGMLDAGHGVDDVRKLIGHAPNSPITRVYAEIRDTRASEVAAHLVSPLKRSPPPEAAPHQTSEECVDAEVDRGNRERSRRKSATSRGRRTA